MGLKISKKRKEKVLEFVLSHKNYLKSIITEAESRKSLLKNKIYLCKWNWISKRKGYRLNDDTHIMEELLQLTDFKNYFSNDAPRGGKEGDFIGFKSKKAVDFLLSIKNLQ
ncbi:MAG: hypothetical protein J0G96_13535 [Flavobacteriia bacterium]|nr:hypothetical protein [Flavobacteriia bacterium]OJX39606.1 MAG: hypothetical protein BGO87_11750 [Flavobacteriia bacterium 40-80]